VQRNAPHPAAPRAPALPGTRGRPRPGGSSQAPPPASPGRAGRAGARIDQRGCLGSAEAQGRLAPGPGANGSRTENKCRSGQERYDEIVGDEVLGWSQIRCPTARTVTDPGRHSADVPAPSKPAAGSFGPRRGPSALRPAMATTLLHAPGRQPAELRAFASRCGAAGSPRDQPNLQVNPVVAEPRRDSAGSPMRGHGATVLRLTR